MVDRPMAMMTKPETRTRLSWLRRNNEPTSVAPMPKMVNTVVKPATNSSEAPTVTRLASRSPSSDTGRAET